MWVSIIFWSQFVYIFIVYSFILRVNKFLRGCFIESGDAGLPAWKFLGEKENISETEEQRIKLWKKFGLKAKKGSFPLKA